MGYTSVRDVTGAVAAAAALARRTGRGPSIGDRATDLAAALPLLIDQVMAESGVAEPQVAARAIGQAAGDLARAVSLIRAWAATLPRLGSSRAAVDEMRAQRRITPGLREAEGGQYLGASLDYESRLLDFDTAEPVPSERGNNATGGPANGHGYDAPAGDGDRPTIPARFGRALDRLEAESVVASADPPAEPVDRTRTAIEAGGGRGPLLQLLARAETGALTAMAYTAQRGYSGRVDPTLMELRSGTLPVRVVHPRLGVPVRVGSVTVTTAEVVLYQVHDGEADARFTLGVGATFGCLERRAIAAAVLDANCTRATGDGRDPEPPEDAEFLSLVLDGQEASGFVEHLKLPHHVTFTSDVDRVRRTDPTRAGPLDEGALSEEAR